MKKLINVLVGLAIIPVTAIAQESTSRADVVGMFANEGDVGIYAYTLTVSDAHRECTKELPSGERAVEDYEGDSRGAYKTCMAQYVPFKESGAGQANACVSTSVSWQNCSATLPSQPDGSTYTAKNSFDKDNFEGFANFQCSGGAWTYVSGGCSRAVNKCEDGEVVDWPVTSPLWADETTETVFTDKFGVIRHTPKGRCYARMPEALSGKLLIAKPTTPEMVSPDRYRMNASQEPNRCFDSEWLSEPGSGNVACEYIPKSCKSKTYTHPSGCNYNIPSGSHDEVFSSNNPTPQNSVGTVTAHCWDGEWEIKSSSCQLSCEANIPSYSWGAQGPSSRMCSHPAIPKAERVAPGSGFIVENEEDGMSGSVGYTCNNGSLDVSTETCSPQSCSSLPENEWSGNDGSICSHPRDASSGAHDTSLTKNVRDTFSSSTGYASYTCRYGEWVEEETNCSLNETKNRCFVDCSFTCPDDAVFYDSGFCCYDHGDGTSTCAPTEGCSIDSDDYSIGVACEESGNTSTECAAASTVDYGYGKSAGQASLTLIPTVDGIKPEGWRQTDCSSCTWEFKESESDIFCEKTLTSDFTETTNAPPKIENLGQSGGIKITLFVADGNLDASASGECSIRAVFDIFNPNTLETERVSKDGTIRVFTR